MMKTRGLWVFLSVFLSRTVTVLGTLPSPPSTQLISHQYSFTFPSGNLDSRTYGPSGKCTYATFYSNKYKKHVIHLSKQIDKLSNGRCTLHALNFGSDKSIFKGRVWAHNKVSKNKFAGISSKVKAVKKVLEGTQSETIIWIDATVHVSKILNFSWEAFPHETILLARNGVRQRSVNIGVMAMRNTAEIHRLLDKAIRVIEKYGYWDQHVFNCLLKVNTRCNFESEDIGWSYLPFEQVAVLKTTHKCPILIPRPSIIKFIGEDTRKLSCMAKYQLLSSGRTK